MTAGRPKAPAAEVIDVQVNEDAIKAGGNALNIIATAQREAATAIVEIARRMEYQGSLNPDDLEASLKADKDEMGNVIFRAGTRLLLLKEQCPNGEFLGRLRRSGWHPREAQRAMQAAFAFSISDASTSTHPNVQKVQRFGKSKVFELFTLEDKEIDELKETGSVRGITLDEMDRMSVSELRAKLKQAEEEVKATKAEATANLLAKEQLLATVRERANKAEEELSAFRIKGPPTDKNIENLNADITRNGKAADDALKVIEMLVESIDEVTTIVFDQEGSDRSGAVALIQRTRDQALRLASTVGRIQAAVDMRLMPAVEGLEQYIPYTTEDGRPFET